MSKNSRTLVLLTFTALLLSATAQGAKVYKWVDEDGRVTYRDKPPPPESGGEVQEKDLNTNSNVIQYEAPPEPAKDDPAQKGDTNGRPPSGNEPKKGEVKKMVLDYRTYDDVRRRLEPQRQ